MFNAGYKEKKTVSLYKRCPYIFIFEKKKTKIRTKRHGQENVQEPKFSLCLFTNWLAISSRGNIKKKKFWAYYTIYSLKMPDF